MLTLTFVAKWAWIGLLMWGVRPDRASVRTARRIARFITPLMVAQNIGVVLAVMTCGTALMVFVPASQWSWLSMFGGDAQNANLAPMRVPWLAWAFIPMLLLKLPTAALWEERLFRGGTASWGEGAARSLAFGLVHCLVGVPLGIGLALALAGLWFTRQYMWGGAVWSAAHHLTYNLAALTLFGALVWSV
jgi:hypothetical protein